MAAAAARRVRHPKPAAPTSTRIQNQRKRKRRRSYKSPTRMSQSRPIHLDLKTAQELRVSSSLPHSRSAPLQNPRRRPQPGAPDPRPAPPASPPAVAGSPMDPAGPRGATDPAGSRAAPPHEVGGPARALLAQYLLWEPRMR